MARKPRIITETVAFLRNVAAKLDNRNEGAERDQLAIDCEEQARKLDAYDARETRLDPSKRKAKAKRAKR